MIDDFTSFGSDSLKQDGEAQGNRAMWLLDWDDRGAGASGTHR
jgi:hypothetical protein